jgi:hypothetical protein
MTTTTRSIDGGAGPGGKDRRAFTLTEVMLAATLSAFVLAGVLSTVWLIGRSGLNTAHYGELETEARRALETFAEDARQAIAIHWNSGQSITLTVPTANDAVRSVTYGYDSDTNSATCGCFFLESDPAAGPPVRRVLMRGVSEDFAFHRYKREQAGAADSAANDLETRQIQVSLRAVRTAMTTAATQTVVSARYVLRNKRVNN